MKFVLAAVLILATSGCSSWFESNQPYLSSSSNIIPGERVVANNSTTAYALAKKYKVPMNDLIVLNRMPSPYVISPGQEVILPATVGAISEQPSWSRPLAQPSIDREPLVPRNTLRNNAVTVDELPPLERQPSRLERDAGSSVALTDFGHDEKFLWPITGPILMAYGPRNSGGQNDGINIGAPRGTPVVAAANGVVLYAGQDTKGFGNLVLIRHGNAAITAYAHLDRMVVDKDSVVAKGDMIGTVGSTGDVKGPQLHFEIRKNSKPIDPMPLLPPAADIEP
jgi:murein DD-endopeptidase MepM/ murein hydrolase activator NlpD